jgi:ribonuclease D
MSLIERSGLGILKAIALHNGQELLAMVKARSARNHPSKEAFRRLQSKISVRADELGINVELLATRREITEILRGEYSKRIRQGWRAKELKNLI